MAEPKVGDYCYYLPELFEVRSIVRHQVHRIVGVTSNKRYVVPLTQLQPPNIVDRAAISVGELSEMQHRIEEQQKKIDNSEMLGTAGARLEEELRQLKLESQRLGDQLLETKRQLEYAGNQRESCRQEAGGNIEERVGGRYKCSRNKNKGMYRSGGRAGVLSSGVGECRERQ